MNKDKKKKVEKKNPLKKMGNFEGEKGTRLDPYYREKVNVRDLPDLIEEEDFDMNDEY